MRILRREETTLLIFNINIILFYCYKCKTNIDLQISYPIYLKRNFYVASIVIAHDHKLLIKR